MSAYAPALQGLHVAEPFAAKLPRAQMRHETTPVDALSGLLRPAGHATHAVAPCVDEKVPGEHTEQLDASDAPRRLDDDPGLQRLQLAEPGEDENDPAAQALHELASLAPTTEDAVPAAHGVHVAEPFAAKLPRGQTRQESALTAALPALLVPAGHATHAVAPCVDENVPGEHTEQLDASDAPRRLDEDPGLQRLQLAEPGEDANDPAGQALHELASLAPTTGEAVPAEHGVHVAEPAPL